MRVLRNNSDELGKWRTERINILEEYEACFGELPPGSALRLAVMTDSDDTGQQTQAAIDWIRIRRD